MQENNNKVPYFLFFAPSLCSATFDCCVTITSKNRMSIIKCDID